MSMERLTKRMNGLSYSMCGSVKEVRLCPATDCPLYPYRLGHIDKGIYKNAPDAEQAEKP
jgi:hypothetical protein